MADAPAHPGPDDSTSKLEPFAANQEPGVAGEVTESAETVAPADTGRFIRTWVWMILVSGFGLFLVFGSVTAHYWDENARGTFYVPVTRGMQVLDIWRAQVNGLPDVAHQGVLKSVFLVSVFGFIGLSVIALWLATVEIWNGPPTGKNDSNSGEIAENPVLEAAAAPSATAG